MLLVKIIAISLSTRYNICQMDESWILISHICRAWPKEAHSIVYQAGHAALTQCVTPALWPWIQPRGDTDR